MNLTKILTDSANCEIYKVSSNALFPPPTITGYTLAGGASQVAQKDIPFSINLFSSFKPKFLCTLPVATSTYLSLIIIFFPSIKKWLSFNI